ncbi:uncharacterized protein PV07_08868 [Cladophialophora immunda]|uniref:Xylanolytic transcriptional activator regulatory domain-containing protein n=1 Tax=Cladophialophora immunda TaxID=569365 RepID=A0A0D2AL23_9EURO|nr:uncharacterized protein PV07_08868 [Cladophialophora immunda]KIW25712.1 hypothetical protein PV07_08868 [Cladophialophora immunda]OQU96303.1 Fungal specific transcription factor domain-containing protein [Cladophialophora immunda]
MQREIDRLRTARASATPPPKSFESRPASSVEPVDDAATHLMLDSGPDTVGWPPLAPSFHDLEPRISKPSSTGANLSSALPRCAMSQSLNGVHVDGLKIDDCFQLYFKHYHPMLPILDASCRPDTYYYKLSPFVFWCVVITGSRRYELDPTLLGRLSPGVTVLASKALQQTSSYFSTIRGLMILCTWPLPMKTILDDPSPMYSGAAMQLALQHGLHMLQLRGAVADVSYEPFLARTWAYLEFSCHCTSWSCGMPPHRCLDAFDVELPCSSDASRLLPPSTYWMQKFEKVVARADEVLADTVRSGGPLATLRSLINVFDDQILEVSRKALEDMRSDASMTATGARTDDSVLPNPLIVTTARVHVNAYHFFGADPSEHMSGLVELSHLIRQFAEQASKMDGNSDWAFYASEPYFRHICLLLAMLLRMSHSRHLRLWIDMKQGERTFFALLKLLKRRSLQFGDVNAHVVTLFSQLWHDDSIFRLQDGSQDSLHVHTRGRGAFGILYDCLTPPRPRDSSHAPVEALHARPGGDALHDVSCAGTTALTNETSVDSPLPADDDFLGALPNELSWDFVHDGSQWPNESLFWEA